MTQLIPTLAAVDVRAILGLIVVVFFVLAKIVSAIKKEVDAFKRKGTTSQPGIGPTSGSQTARERLDALAARRREELRRLAQARPAEPDNMTMSQRVERERARAIYQQRAEQLKGYRSPDPAAQPQRPSANTSAPAPAPAPTVDAHQAAMENTRRRAAAQAEQARRAAAERRQAEAVEAKRAEQQRRLAATQEKARDAKEEPVLLLEEAEPSKPAKTKTGRPAAGVKSRYAKPSRQSLRDALIFKEILDPPVAFRQPEI